MSIEIIYTEIMSENKTIGSNVPTLEELGVKPIDYLTVEQLQQATGKRGNFTWADLEQVLEVGSDLWNQVKWYLPSRGTANGGRYNPQSFTNPNQPQPKKTNWPLYIGIGIAAVLLLKS